MYGLPFFKIPGLRCEFARVALPLRLRLVGWDGVRLGWFGMGAVRLGLVRLGVARLACGCIAAGRIGSDWLGPDPVGPGWHGPGSIGLGWIAVRSRGLEWLGLCWFGLRRFRLAWPDSIVAFRLRSTRRRSRGAMEFHPITLPFRERSPPLSQTGSSRVRVEWVGLGWFGLRLDGAGVNWTGCNCVAGDSGRLHRTPHACHGVD